MKKLENMKPCPFCGNDDIWLTDGDLISYIEKQYYEKLRAVVCTKCNIHGKVFNTLARLTPEEAEQKAVEAWNRRV